MHPEAETDHAGGLNVEWLVVLVVLVVVLAGLVAYFWPAPSVPSERALDANRAAGSAAVIAQSSQVHDAMVRYVNELGSQRTMTLDDDATTGIFAANLEGGHVPVAPPGVFEGGSSPHLKWLINPQVSLPGQAGAWYAVVLPKIKKPLCQKLNAILHKDNLNTEPPISVHTIEQWVGGGVVLDGADSRLTRRDGCAMASGGEFVFYRTVIRR